MIDILFSNNWIIGILTGIISSVIVYFFTSFIVRKTENRQYLDRVNGANIAIINNLRKYILNSGIPSEVLFSATKQSIAREYAVFDKDLYTNEQICQEFVNEIIGNEYVPQENKNKCLNYLENYIKQYEENMLKTQQEAQEKVQKTTTDKLTKYISFYAAIASIIGTVLGIIVSFL